MLRGMGAPGGECRAWVCSPVCAIRPHLLLDSFHSEPQLPHRQNAGCWMLPCGCLGGVETVRTTRVSRRDQRKLLLSMPL